MGQAHTVSGRRTGTAAVFRNGRFCTERRHRRGKRTGKARRKDRITEERVMKEMSTYLTFDGNCRQAMEFYKRCLGGELFLMPLSETPEETQKDAKDLIMHATLRNGSIALIASDRWGDHPYQAGNNFSICIAP